MNNIEKGRKFIAGGLATLVIASTSLTGCSQIHGYEDVIPTVSNNFDSSSESITSRPIPSETPQTSKPTITSLPESTSKTTEIPLITTPEKRTNPSIITSRGNKNKAEIAFTFDDSGENLVKILNILNEKEIKGTFFLLAKELKRSPEVWQKAIKDGHQICNHSVGHRMDLGKLSEEEIKKEILGWETVCKDVLGEEYLNKMKKEFPYFRSPGGNRTNRLQQVLGDLGYPITAYWGVEDCWFKTHNPNNLTMVENYVQSAKNGEIFLLHGGNYGYVAEIIDKVQEKNYKFATLSEVLS